MLVLVAPCTLLLGAVLEILVARLFSARSKGILAFLFSLPAIFSVAALAPSVRNGQAIDLKPLPWDGPLALVLHVDALSVLFAFMGACIGGLVLLYSIGYMAHDKSATRFYATMLVFIGGFIALVYSANLLIFYLCWELVGLCSFSLVGFWYTNREAVNGARKVLLMTHIAGYGLLAAILVLYHRTGSALWTNPAVARSFTSGIFVLMLVALVAKSVQVPLHTWIPEAMAAPTPVSALLHAACYVKAGVYLAARMHSLGPGVPTGGSMPVGWLGAWPMAWGSSLVWVGTVTMAVGVMYAMVQTDLKRMLAFSTVSQIGYMMMGLGIGTPLAITAGLLHCLNHGFFKGGLFLTAGSVQHASGTRDMNELGGLAGKMPHTTLSWLIGVDSMMGIPLMSGFASKWMLYAAALQAGWVAPALVAWAASLGTVFLGAKATSAVFLGPVTEHTKDAHESPPSMLWGMGLLAAGSVVLGVAPQLAVNYLLNPILAGLGLGAGVHVTWLGLSADAGSFSSTGGLVLALVSVVLGGGIYALAYAARGATASGAAMAGAGGGVFTGGEPLGEQGRLTAGDFSEIFKEHWRSFFRWTNVDRAYLAVWSGLQAVSRALGALFAWMEQQATFLLVLFAAAIFILTRWIVPGAVPGWPHLPAVAPMAMIPPLLILAVAVAASGLLLAALCSEQGRKLAPLLLLIGVLTVDGLLTVNAWLRCGVLETAALLTAILVWRNARSRLAKTTYLAVVLISAAAAVAGQAMAAGGNQELARALLLTGFAVKLAVVPLCFWLLALADEVPALVLGIIIAVVDMAAFGEFLLASQELPGLLEPQVFLLYLAALTSLVAALLMLTQRSLKRLLVLSTVEDAGFLLLGAASASLIGIQGALIAACTHALAKALLFACLSAPEAAGALEQEPVGLAARYPVSAFGFLFGMLAMLGVPPTLGFIGRWRLYAAALHMGTALLVLFILSSVFALIAYAMALARNWWGPRPVNDTKPGTEPLALQAAIILIAVLLVAAGLWPNAWQVLMGVRP